MKARPLIAMVPASGPGVGGGHVMRCLALAMALKERDARCVFVTKGDGAAILSRFGAGFDICNPPTDDIAPMLDAMAPHAVVIDDYSRGADFERALSAPVVMVIDDLANRSHAAQLLLDPGYGREAGDYAGLTDGATLLLGPRHALLRPGFEGEAKPVRETPSRLFVSFGLSDVEGITVRVVRRLLRQEPDAAIDVALAGSAPSLAMLELLAAAHPRLIVHIDADTAPLMRAADAAIGAGGSMTWERRALALPSLTVIVAENQRSSIERLAADGVVLAVNLKSPRFEAEFDAAFATLKDPAIRRAMIDNPLATCDGRGAARAANALLAAMSRCR